MITDHENQHSYSQEKEYQTGDKDPQQDVGEDDQKGSQQLTTNWLITQMENTNIPAELEPSETTASF